VFIRHHAAESLGFRTLDRMRGGPRVREAVDYQDDYRPNNRDDKAVEIEPNDPAPPSLSTEVIGALALFRAPDDSGQTELLLDRAGNVGVCWTANQSGGLAPPTTLPADAEHVARMNVASPSHSGSRLLTERQRSACGLRKRGNTG
jgi:hypothetical protein